MSDPAMMTHEVIAPAWPNANPRDTFKFIELNGFLYRINTSTGETWRLEFDKQNKKSQVWVAIQVQETTK
jgi:hypothetical protein